ncbi:unnamed protein product [Meloidogyne enterolobii]|uniref:Uncharacterized protein n=1 Tax=Meloidogyne enterolobii TaxID=390850 RepID=A0ACB1AZK1_MELEN
MIVSWIFSSLHFHYSRKEEISEVKGFEKEKNVQIKPRSFLKAYHLSQYTIYLPS